MSVTPQPLGRGDSNDPSAHDRDAHWATCPATPNGVGSSRAHDGRYRLLSCESLVTLPRPRLKLRIAVADAKESLTSTTAGDFVKINGRSKLGDQLLRTFGTHCARNLYIPIATAGSP